MYLIKRCIREINEKKAACIIPVKKELTEPRGEILYNSLILIVSIFLNLGAGLLVNKIGTSATESKIETRKEETVS